MDFRTSIDIAAPPGRVWEVVIDVVRWHEWTGSITSVERLEAGPFEVGSRARVRQPRALPAIWRVTALEPGRRFTWVTAQPGVHATAIHEVEPRDGGSRAILGVSYAGPLGGLLGWLLAGMTRRYLTMEAEGLKARAEHFGEGPGARS